MLAQEIEPFFSDLAEQGILVARQRRGDLGPVLNFQGSEGCRKEIAIFHPNVMPLVLDEIANDYTDIFSKHLSIGQNSVDSFGNSVQTLGALLVLACEIANSLRADPESC